MGETAKATKKTSAAAPANDKAKKEVPKVVKQATKTHPKTSEMVNVAIGTLKDRKGSSLQAIKKYIAGHYVVDVQRLSPFIRKYLKSAVEKNIIVQTAGNGAAGRFKLAKSEAPKKSVVKKTVSQPMKSPKSKKSGKAPATKTKSPKPKTARTN